MAVKSYTLVSARMLTLKSISLYPIVPGNIRGSRVRISDRLILYGAIATNCNWEGDLSQSFSFLVPGGSFTSALLGILPPYYYPY